MGSVRTDYDRIAEKLGPEITRSDPIVANCLQGLETGFGRTAVVENALVACIKVLSVTKSALLEQAFRLEALKPAPMLVVVTKERLEEL